MTARNLTIITAIRSIQHNYGFDATVNPASRKASACSIVAKACERAGFEIRENAILKIWQKRKVYDQERDRLLKEWGLPPVGN